MRGTAQRESQLLQLVYCCLFSLISSVCSEFIQPNFPCLVNSARVRLPPPALRTPYILRPNGESIVFVTEPAKRELRLDLKIHVVSLSMATLDSPQSRDMSQVQRYSGLSLIHAVTVVLYRTTRLDKVCLVDVICSRSPVAANKDFESRSLHNA